MSVEVKAEQKRATLSRLRRWRANHGPGCLDAVTQKAGKRFSPESLRDICYGGVVLTPVEWRSLARALDKLAAEDEKAARNG